MCTVSYFKNKEGYVLTSNRDERFNRATSVDIVKQRIGGEIVSYPKDLEAGGTWCASSNSRTHCLLNGAFDLYTYSPPYRMSRGKMMLELFEQPFMYFIDSFEFEGMEPFTLISILENNDLYETRWDGTKLYNQKLKTEESYLWCSSTLYTLKEQDYRKNLLNALPVLSPSSVLALHQSENYKLDIGDKGTVSVTQVIHANESSIKYYPIKHLKNNAE